MMSYYIRPSGKMLAGLLLFLGLSIADLYLTWRLIVHGGDQVFESNPVAYWWLATYGWLGMTVFKLGMFLAIGALVVVIGWARPRTGEFLLIFGCGAQSAIVATSIFMVQAVDEVRRVASSPNLETGLGYDDSDPLYQLAFLPEDGMFLLNDEAVLEELRLTEAQLKKIDKLDKLRREVRVGLRRLNPDQLNLKIYNLMDEERAFLEMLRPDQVKRFLQISWQQRGPLAFLDPEVCDALRITPEQYETIQGLVEEAKKQPNIQSSKDPDPLASTKDRLVNVLTSAQKSKWEKMVGEPFLRNTPPTSQVSWLRKPS